MSRISVAGDITGSFLINATYGILEIATWVDADQDPYDLSELVTQFQQINSGFFPNDNPINLPEAGTLALTLIAALLLDVRKSRRSR